MSGTAFTPGQVAELNTIVMPSLTMAIINVATNSSDAKTLLASVRERNEVLTRQLETALELVFTNLRALKRCEPATVVIEQRFVPDEYYNKREDIWVHEDVDTKLLARAKPVEAGTVYKINVAELTIDRTDEQIEQTLPEKHIFEGGDAFAVIGWLIEKQLNGESGVLAVNDKTNLFYLDDVVIDVLWMDDSGDWGINLSEREEHADTPRIRGGRVIYPAK